MGVSEFPTESDRPSEGLPGSGMVAGAEQGLTCWNQSSLISFVTSG